MRRQLFLVMLLCQFFWGKKADAAQYAVTTGLNNDPTFTPAVYTINVGDTITWFYAGSGNPFVFCTEDDGIPMGAAPWSATLDFVNGQYSYVPTVPGVYNYKCGMYPGMTGQFTVIGCASPTNVVVSGNGAICSGGSDMLTVTANDADSYQWFFNGALISGQTGTTFNALMPGTYTCEAENSCGTTMSNTFTITAGALPPTNVAISGYSSLCESPNNTLTVTSTGGTAYQWRVNGINIPGETNNTYIATVPASYSCIVYNPCGDSIISTGFTVVSGNAPSNVVVSGNNTICEGDNSLLTATAVGGVTYQWYRNGTLITGATSTTYNVNLSGDYTCTAYNSCGSDVSGVFNVVYNPAPAPVATVINTGNTYSFTGTAPGATSWNWDFGDMTTSLLQNPQHTYLAAGNYTVVLTVTYPNGCTRTDTLAIEILPTEVKNEVVNKVILSPNPAQNFLTINTTEAISVEVYDMAGKRVTTLKESSGSGASGVYDISNISSGLYLLHVRSKENTSIVKFTIIK